MVAVGSVDVLLSHILFIIISLCQNTEYIEQLIEKEQQSVMASLVVAANQWVIGILNSKKKRRRRYLVIIQMRINILKVEVQFKKMTEMTLFMNVPFNIRIFSKMQNPMK